MRTIFILLMSIILLAAVVPVMAQTPSQGAVIAPITIGGCGSAYGTVCDGTNANFWNTGVNDTCAESPILTSGTYSGFALLFCVNDYEAVLTKIDYSTTPPTPTVVNRQWVETWLNTNTGSGLPATPCVTNQGTPTTCVVEQHMIFDPFINTSATPPGAFVLGTKDSLACPVLAVSTTADPTGTWNTWAAGTHCGDNVPTVGFDANQLVFGILNLSPLSGVYYVWTNASPSFHQKNMFTSIPSPDATFDNNSSPEPGEIGQPMQDYTVGKSTSDPMFWISNCRVVTYPCGGSTSTTSVVVDEINSTGPSTVTLTQKVLTTSLTLGVPTTNNQPNNVIYNTSNVFYEQDGIELSNRHFYTRRSTGTSPIVSNTLEIDGSTPASLSIVNRWRTGSSTQGDATFVSFTADAANNVIGNGMLSSASLALVPYTSWIPTSGSSPYITTGTITASGGSCPSTSCIKSTFPSANVGSVSVQITSAFTGTIVFQNSAGGSLTCTDVLGGGGGITSIATTGTVTCATGGLSGVQFKATALSAGTPSVKITPQFGPFYQNAATSTGSISTAGANCTTSTNCATLSIPSGVTQVMVMVAAPTSFVGTLQFEGNLGAITATLAGSSGASPTTASSMTGSDANCTGFDPCAWTFNVGSNSSIDVRASTLTSGGPVTITFETVAANSRANNAVNLCLGGGANSGKQEMSGNFQLARVGTVDPYRMWAFPAYGGTTNFCSYTYEAVQFGVHVPAAGANIVTSPSNATISAGTQAFTATATYIDGLSDAGPQCLWSSSNTGVATVNSTTGVATAVSPGSTNITMKCSGVVSNPASGLTVSATTGYFPTH